MVNEFFTNTTRVIEYKYFQVEHICSHNKCGSFGISWGKYHVEFHLGWHRIVFGDNHNHTMKWREYNER